MSGYQPPPVTGGPSNSMSMPPQTQGQGPQTSQGLSSQNLNQIVLEYLTKKGYNKTEAALRAESANVDANGRPIFNPEEDLLVQYNKGFNLLSDWVEHNLDIYKFELSRLLWPVFVYAYLDLVTHNESSKASMFFQANQEKFERTHAEQLRILETVTLPTHVEENSTTKLYRSNKYRIPINKTAYYNLITYLESNDAKGGSAVISLIQNHCNVTPIARGPIDQFSFEAIAARAHGSAFNDPADLLEGIPGAFTGITNQDKLSKETPLKLGPLQMDPELRQDVRAELENLDNANPLGVGQVSLVETFDQNIKREESVDAIQRSEIPLPPTRARDIVMEVQKVREYRDRFKIEGRTGGVGPQTSVVMYTFHNTLDNLTCIEFSDDNLMVAAGTQDSYIRVWNLNKDALDSVTPVHNDMPATFSRRLIGHAAPVYSVSFSPSIASPKKAGAISTSPRLLLSSSSDSTVRLWSLETWSCLINYKGHEGPVWNVKWGPFGHYFATCGRDKTVRVWAQDHISYLRMMIGHDDSANQIAWHPNGAYLFSASDGCDKTIRMWSVNTGERVRVFTGHTDFISTLECAPNGKMLASGDGAGTIILWDIEKGQQLKRCRGHGRGGIWSLSFSVESTVLTSGGADGTVRVWDINVPADPYKNNPDADGGIIATGGQADATRISGSSSGAILPGATIAPKPVATSGVSGGGKKKTKEVQITPDQISAFPTKDTPVFKVKFNRMNLILAGGCYQG